MGDTTTTSDASQVQQPDTNLTKVYVDADYAPKLNNWYTARPYGFKFIPEGSTTAMVMYLPISPANLTVTTHFATTLTPTLYGTVEEHSPVRYYDIVIEGTTGMAPKYTRPFTSTPPNSGRSTFLIDQTISSNAAGGFFSKTLSTVNQVVGDTKALFANWTSQFATETGIKIDQTGYAAFHNLYRFLLKHKKDTSGQGTNEKAPLVFFNYKDNNQYYVTVRTFTMRRDKEDPMVYHYSIVMRGYNLAAADAADTSKLDWNGQLKALGLDGMKSTVQQDIRRKAEAARALLASVGNGINTLGR